MEHIRQLESELAAERSRNAALASENKMLATSDKGDGMLHAAGYYKGPIDGIFGGATLCGMENYQRANGLLVGQLTIETADHLGVSY